MRVEPEYIQNIRPFANYVLVEPIVKTDEIEFGKLKLMFDNAFHREKYQPIVCRVVSIAKKLIYDPTKIPTVERDGSSSWRPRYENTMPWKIEKQVKCEDVVWINYYPIVRAEDENDETVIVYSGDKKYYFIHYEDIYCVKRKNDVIMVNGYILVTPIPAEENKTVENLKKAGLFIPTETQTIDKYGIVAKIGIPVEEYEDGELCGEDSDFIQEGDCVRFAMDFNRHLETSDLHKWFDGKDYIVSRRRNLLGICKMEN